MTVYFCSDSDFDLNTIRMMGVSVKNSSNPIGYFGTGMKYAIATLLRTGHKIDLFLGSEVYSFTARETAIRGEAFQQVYMNDEPLAFTTELGKNWEVWQAYRELHSNTLDEAGTIGREHLPAKTVFAVSGAGIVSAYYSRAEIFLETAPIAKNNCLEIHSGGSRFIYYRGVRAGVIPSNKRSKFTYNILAPLELTEDRTIKSQWSMELLIEKNVPQILDREHATKLLQSPAWDSELNYTYCPTPSEGFLDAAEALLDNARLNPHVRKLITDKRQNVRPFKPCLLTDYEAEIAAQAIRVLKNQLCADLEPDEITFTETLGPAVYSIFQRSTQQIFIARQTLSNGVNFTAATIFEEWLHKRHNLMDETREMQQFLFDRLIAMAMSNEWKATKK